MSSRTFTGEEVIDMVRDKAKVPNKNTTGTTDADILERINEAMMSVIVPVIRRNREGYFLQQTRIPISTDRSTYRIPERAIGQQVHTLYYWDGSQRIKMTRIDPGRIHEHTGVDFRNNPTFFIKGNSIALLDSGATGYLEVSYLARPGHLVLSTDALQIESVDTDTSIITLSGNVPTGWESTSRKFDIHSQYSGGELKQINLTKVDATGSTIEVEDTLDGSVFGTEEPEAGDWVCLAGEAALPAVPQEFVVPLVQAAVCSIVESLGDVEGLAAHRQALGEMLLNEQAIIANRTDSHPKKVSPRNPLWTNSRSSVWRW